MKTCPGCGSDFDSPKRKYCTTECAFKHRRKRDATKWAIFTCAWCGKSFETWAYRQQRFCSRQCTSEYGARQPKPSQRKPENFVHRACKSCGKVYTVHQCQVILRNSSYCSRECKYKEMSKQKQGQGNPNYKGGRVKYRGRNWGTQSRAAMKRDGYKCQICGKKRKQGERWQLGVHHIIPYRDFGGDYEKANQLNNLITLCRNCHSKVEFGDLPCPRPLF